MSRIRFVALALVSAAVLAACSAPTAPSPSVRTIDGPSFSDDTTSNTGRSGYTPING